MTLPAHMQCILLTGHGGLEMLKVVGDHPLPAPGEGEVLIEVGADRLVLRGRCRWKR